MLLRQHVAFNAMGGDEIYLPKQTFSHPELVVVALKKLPNPLVFLGMYLCGYFEMGNELPLDREIPRAGGTLECHRRGGNTVSRGPLMVETAKASSPFVLFSRGPLMAETVKASSPFESVLALRSLQPRGIQEMQVET